MLSRKFIEKLKLWPEAQYKVALKARIHPGMLSKWVIGLQQAKYGDPRILRVAKILGLRPSEVFVESKKIPE